jgi:hypothetical protein
MKRIATLAYIAFGMLCHDTVYGDASLTLVSTWVRVLFWPLVVLAVLFWYLILIALIGLILWFFRDAILLKFIR